MMRMERKTERRLAFFIVLAMMLALVGCTPESPPVDPPSVTPTEVVVGVPSDTPTPVPSVSATPTVEPTVTNTPTPTEEVLSVTPTEEVAPTATPTDEPEITDTPTPDPTATNTPVPTNTPTKVPDTPTPVVTNTPKPTSTPTKAPTKAPTATPTQPPATNTPTPKPTATNTPTPEPTPTQVVVEQPKTMWVNRNVIDVYAADTSFTKIGELKLGDEVTVVHVNVLNRDDNYVSEIEYGGGRAYVQYILLSASYVEPKWAEPRERKDLEEILMAKVNAYRESKGIRKLEDPCVYYEVESKMPADYLAGGTPASGLGSYLYNKGLRVAKRECLREDARHEGSQIGTGWYGPAIKEKQGGLTNEQLCEKLFQQWKNSSGHNENMLDARDGEIMTAVMTVVEYYNGSYWGYCAIMSVYSVKEEWLPDGLQ